MEEKIVRKIQTTFSMKEPLKAVQETFSFGILQIVSHNVEGPIHSMGSVRFGDTILTTG